MPDTRTDYSAMDDASLMRRAQDSDTDAFNAIVTRYRPMFVGMLQRRFRIQRETAEDATQDTFMQAFRARNTYDGRARLSSWLTTIALHSALNIIRKQKSDALWYSYSIDDAVPTDDDDRKTPAVDRLPDPHPLADRLLEGQEAAAALAQLPPDDKSTIESIFFRDMRECDAAKIFNVQSRTITNRIERALVTLRRVLSSSSTIAAVKKPEASTVEPEPEIVFDESHIRAIVIDADVILAKLSSPSKFAFSKCGRGK